MNGSSKAEVYSTRYTQDLQSCFAINKYHSCIFHSLVPRPSQTAFLQLYGKAWVRCYIISHAPDIKLSHSA